MILTPLALAASLALLGTQSAEPTVSGLNADESFTVLAPGPGPTDDFAHGRVVDAFTGAPLSGATIELWSEEIDDHYGGYHRFGVATSGRDGRFMVRRRDGARTADKLRASAPGYLVFTESAGALHDVITLFPAEAEAPRIRFVDLQDRPIQGARVTTTYTCAHDIAAFEYTSDVNGVVVLEGYGLQDSIPELRVLAPGFAGIKYLDGEPILMAAARGDVYVQRLRRLPGLECRLLDESGEALANCVVMVHDGDGHHVSRTDDDGTLSIPARYDDGEFSVQRLAPDPGPGGYGLGPVIRLDASDWDGGVPTGRVRIVWKDAPPGVTTAGLEVLHLEGWTDTVDSDGWVELPAGPAILVHEPDSGTRQRATPPIVVIAGQSVLVEMKWIEPVVAAVFPAGLGTRIVVERGERSIEFSSPEGEALEIPLFEPGSFTLWLPELDHVEHHTTPLDAGEIDALTTLARTAFADRASSAPDAQPARLSFPLDPSTRIDARSPAAAEVDVEREDRGAIISGPSGPLLLHLTRDGHADRWLRTLLGVSLNAAHTKLVPLAALRIEARGPIKLEGYDELEDLQELHPGPFDCVVRTADGTRIGLRLELAPGEQRVLRLE